MFIVLIKVIFKVPFIVYWNADTHTRSCARLEFTLNENLYDPVFNKHNLVECDRKEEDFLSVSCCSKTEFKTVSLYNNQDIVVGLVKMHTHTHTHTLSQVAVLKVVCAPERVCCAVHGPVLLNIQKVAATGREKTPSAVGTVSQIQPHIPHQQQERQIVLF